MTQPNASEPLRDFWRIGELRDAIIEAVRAQDGVGGIKAFGAYDDFLQAEGAVRAALATPPPALDVARSFLTPMEHLPARMVGDPDDMPRCVACRFMLTPRSGHAPDCAVGAYIAFLSQENR